jgi:CubicO group peptidase (beta-lactamase class C family)
VSVLAALVWFFTDDRLTGVAAALDRDGSGALETDEVGPVIDRSFRRIDADLSGGIDGVEFRRWVLGQWLRGATAPLAIPELPERPSEADLRAWLRAPVEGGDLAGVALLVLVDGEVVFRHAEGELAPDAPVPLASASKWPAAAVFGCLHERGDLDLTRPLGTFAPAVPDTWAALTPVQLLSHTAGTRARHVLGVAPEASVATAGRDLVRTVRPDAPGTLFRYGGESMQVAAWWAEARTGRPWRRLFVECLAWPLSLDSAGWGHPLVGPAATGFADIGGGLHMSLDDYGAFLSMLQQEGRYGGVRNLSAATIALLEQDRVGALPREQLPPAADPAWGYALGAWCERKDDGGRCTSLSSPGALGAYPWIDRERDVAGVLLVVDALPRVAAWEQATRQFVERLYGRAVISGAMLRPPGG